MSLIPCIVCFKLSESKNKKTIAKVCDNCNKGNLNKILKNLDYKKLNEIIEKGNKNLELTKDGEII